MRPRPLLWILIVSTLLRLVVAATVGLSVDECYAVVMGRHVQLSYFDHPPMTFWLAGAAARLAGTEHALVVRLPFIALAAATTLLMFRLAALLFGGRAGVFAAALVQVTLFYGACGGWVLPDAPLACFALAAALALARAVRGEERSAPAAWMAFGAATGLALLSKYHAIFLPAGALLYLATSPAQRRWLTRPQPWIAGVISAVIFSPVLIWNARHVWASFRFQGGRAVAGGGGSPLLDVVGGQALWLTPWLWIPLLAVLVGALRKGPRDAPRWFLACLAVGPIVGFTTIAALGSRGLPHWALPGYLFVFPLLGASVAERSARGDRMTRGWLFGATVSTALVLVAAVAHVRTGWLTRWAPALFVDGDPTHDLLPWSEVRPALSSWQRENPSAVFAGARWTDAAQLGCALGPAVPVTVVGDDPRGFAHLDGAPPPVGRDVILVVRREGLVAEPMVTHAAFFRRMRYLGAVPVTRDGREELLVSAYLGLEYRLRARDVR